MICPRFPNTAPLFLLGFLTLLAPTARPQATDANQGAGSSSSVTAKPAVALSEQGDAGSSASVPIVLGDALAGYTVSAGDIVDVNVYGFPDLSQKTRVSNAGQVYLPLVGDVHIAGLSLENAQGAVEHALAEAGIVRNPHVNIAVTGIAAGVSISGEVQRPGMYPVMGSHRLADVIAVAGGLTPNAGSVVHIVRHTDPEEPETIVFSRDPMKQGELNISLAQGDAVVVSRAGIIYVVGDVLQPSGFVMEQGSTYGAVKVLAMAHGPEKTASLGKARIIRKTANGELTEVRVPLDRIMASKSPDVLLQAEDILYVPSSSAKAAGRSLVNVVSLATGVALISGHF